ncbi:MAG TPA: alpha-amylase family glycosyl hydrolase [Polyangiaceae bacterium]|nr:alpha-amylase family glycosyl hydrolase [Polyangiaceae bacterium]
MKSSARSVLLALAVATGCGDASVDGSNGNGYPNPPPPPFDAGTGGAGGSGTGGTGGSGAQPPVPPPDGGRDADVRDAVTEADRAPDGSPPISDASQEPDAGGPRPDAGPAGPDGASDVDASPPTTQFSWRDGIIYYIFVDRFLDSSAQNNCVVPGVSPSEVGEPASPAQYRGGDWGGITAKINEGYFQSLGVNALMITSPMTNVGTAGQGIEGDTHYYSGYHGYWPTNVDPMTPSSCFGSPADLATLVSTAHAKGLKVLFDHTIVHVHVSSDIYQQHANWFWTNAGQPWCTCGTANCDWDPANGEGLKCWFTNYLPHWNYGVPEARDFAVRMTLDWITQYGIDGLRLDAIKHVDDAWILATRSAITSEVVPKRPPGSPIYLVGETVDGNIANIAKYVDPVTKLDGQFDFPTRAQIVATVLRRSGQMLDLATFMDQHADDYGPGAVMSTMLGTHDMMRVIHHAENVPVGSGEWDDGKGTTAPRVAGWTTHPSEPSTAEAYERLANGFAVIFTNKGAPLIYYGDEVGLAGAGDPDNRRMMPWSGLGPPQQWLHDRVAKLLKIRAEHPATRAGTRTTIVANRDVWAYTLTSASDKLHVVINRGDSVADVALGAANLTELLEGATGAGPVVSVPARQTRIYQP